MNYSPHKTMMYKHGGGGRGSAIGTVLPLTGEPFEVDIPKGCAKKDDLKEYLSTLPIFKTKDDFEYNEKIELGFYWRNIMTDYKKTPRTCLIFRFSKGTVLPENHLCQFWRADPWKKTYGPIIILRIQDGNTQFRYEDYRLTDYHRQCFYNLQQQQQFFNPSSKNYVGNQQTTTASPAHGFSMPALTMGQRGTTTTNPVTGRPTSFPPSATQTGTQSLYTQRGVSAPPIRYGTPTNPYSATATPSSMSGNVLGRTSGSTPPFTSPGDVHGVSTTSGSSTPSVVVNPYSSSQLNAKSVAPQVGSHQADQIVVTPFQGVVNVRECMDLANFQEKILELSELVVGERWDYYMEDDVYQMPILFHYVYFFILKIIKVPLLKEVLVVEDRILINLGLKKKGTMEDVLMICKKTQNEQNQVRCIVEMFLTWSEAMTKFRAFRGCIKPVPVQFCDPLVERFHSEYYVDFNFDKLFESNKKYFPDKWDNLEPYQLRMLFGGAAMIVRKRISENPRFVTKALWQDPVSHGVGVEYLIPFHLSQPVRRINIKNNKKNKKDDDTDEEEDEGEGEGEKKLTSFQSITTIGENVYEQGFVDFVIAVREVKNSDGGISYRGEAVYTTDWSYAASRPIQRPQQQWLYLGEKLSVEVRKTLREELKKRDEKLKRIELEKQQQEQEQQDQQDQQLATDGNLQQVEEKRVQEDDTIGGGHEGDGN